MSILCMCGCSDCRTCHPEKFRKQDEDLMDREEIEDAVRDFFVPTTSQRNSNVRN